MLDIGQAFDQKCIEVVRALYNDYDDELTQVID
jgi:hypothetical protein